MAHVFFNVNKCKILHIGRENPNFDYEMEDKDGSITNLTVVNCENPRHLCPRQS